MAYAEPSVQDLRIEPLGGQLDNGDIVGLQVRVKGGDAVSAYAQIPHLALTDSYLRRTAEAPRLRECVCLYVRLLVLGVARGQDCLF